MGALWSKVQPTPVPAPRLVAGSPEVLRLLGLDEATLQSDEALRVLFCLATKRDAEEVKTVPYPSRQDYWASAILASALQNNPPALRDVEKAWDKGINSRGRAETGGIRGTRKYIGTPEAQAMFVGLGIP